MGAYEEFVGKRVTIIYADSEADLEPGQPPGTDSITGILRTVDADTLTLETYKGPSLIGRRAVIRLKLARPETRFDTTYVPGGPRVR